MDPESYYPGVADEDAIAGNGDASDYEALTGGVYSGQQDPVTAADNGTMNHATAGSGTAAQTATPPANGAAYTPAAWLTGLLGTASNVATQLTPIINGKPAVSPAAAGQPTPTGANKTVGVGGNKLIANLPLIIGGVVVAIVAWFIFKKK